LDDSLNPFYVKINPAIFQAGITANALTSIVAAMKRLGYSHEISLAIYPYTDRLEEAGRESLAHLLPMLQATGLAF
jgi:hypothetical protein